MRRAAFAFLALVGLAAPAAAQTADASDPSAAAPAPPVEEVVEPLSRLLERLREQAAAERTEDVAREQEFQSRRDAQAAALEKTLAELANEEAIGTGLETRYTDNELEIDLLTERLAERMGQMGELFGVVRLVSTDMSGVAWESLTSLGLAKRNELLDRLGRSTGLPSTQDLERLWYELQREITEQGRVVRLTVPVLNAASEKVEREVVRVGPFTAFHSEGYLQWEPAEQMLRELDRQPPPRYLDSVEAFDDGEGFRRLAIDPSRGTLLEALTATPSVIERIQQGGSVGYTILILGALAGVLGLARMFGLIQTGRKVSAQSRQARPSDDNPLGRVLGVYESYRDLDAEALELKLDEAVLRESGRVERFLWIVQTVSIIAPLLGLLGTVTGMIQTFQAITLIGAGDPKIMAGGISEALVTTTLGLMTAIPLVLLSALLSSRTRGIVEVLDERSAALIVQRREREQIA